MQTIGQIVRLRREALGWTLAQLAGQVGTTKSYLSMIENHRVTRPPSAQLLEALEKALTIDDHLLQKAADWHNTPVEVRRQLEQYAEEIQAAKSLAMRIKNIKNLDQAYESGELSKILDSIIDEDEKTDAAVDGQAAEKARKNSQTTAKTLDIQRVPLINKVAAGYPCDFTDLDYPASVADDYVTCPDLADCDAFAARVVGESMAPQYLEGDVVVFSPAAEVASGDDCFVRIEPDHESTFKRVYFDGDDRIRLQPLNPQFPPAVYERRQVVGLYKAVWKLQKIG